MLLYIVAFYFYWSQVLMTLVHVLFIYFICSHLIVDFLLQVTPHCSTSCLNWFILMTLCDVFV
jgi:hypothetical protein